MASAGTTCEVTGLAAGTEYSFRVRAVAGETAGPWSAVATVTTLPGGGGEQTPEEQYAAWLAEKGLDAATWAMDGRGANGYGNWQNYLWDIAPTNGRGLEVTGMAIGDNGDLVLSVPLASGNRRYGWVHWTGFTPGANPADGADETDLGTGTTNLVVPGGLPDGGFGLLKVTLE